MLTRFIPYLSLGFIIVGFLIIMYQSYWLSIGFHNEVEQEVTASYPSPKNGESLKTTAPLTVGEKIGVLTIPKLDRTLPIYEGVEETTLKKGIGHIPSTPIPGQKSNSVLAGHRDTFFRGLDRLKIGDTLIVTITSDSFIYKIKKIRIVEKDDQTVIVPKPRSTLTLITCYPFTFIGPAPQRYIVEAQRITKPKIEQSINPES